MDDNERINLKLLFIKIYEFIKKTYWRVLLIFLMIGSYDDAWRLGIQANYLGAKEGVRITTNMVSGYNGGAIGFSLIFSICVIMYTWIELNMKKNN